MEQQIHQSGGSPAERERQVQMAKQGEKLSEANGPDSFPEEGTDDKMVQASDTGDVPFSDTEALRATRAVIDNSPPDGETGKG
ncbi:MAG: hypothetical protein ACXU8O_00685 [Asticcacaulis sp.]